MANVPGYAESGSNAEIKFSSRPGTSRALGAGTLFFSSPLWYMLVFCLAKGMHFLDATIRFLMIYSVDFALVLDLD